VNERVPLQVVSPSPAQLGECPVWSVAEQVLYWEDIDGRFIHRYDPSTGGTESVELPGRPGSFVLTEQPGQLIVATEHEVVRLDWETGEVDDWLDLEVGFTGNRMNDGKCDHAGRFIVGSMYEDTSAGRSTGLLHRFDASGEPELLRADIGVSNGLAFDAERGLMYFADTPTMRILVSDYDTDSGEISNERLFFNYSKVLGKPDGACLDADGCYWSASVHGWAVVRITPDGVVDRRIELPVKKPSMPAFGGPNLDTLYVTSIGGDIAAPPADDFGARFNHGDLLALDVGAQGLPEPLFRV
jgi:L-arabinonolactonase